MLLKSDQVLRELLVLMTKSWLKSWQMLNLQTRMTLLL